MIPIARKQRSVELLEPGQEAMIRFEDIEVHGCLQAILSDGDILKAVLASGLARFGNLHKGQVITVSFTKEYDGRSNFFTFESTLLDGPQEEQGRFMVTVTVPDWLSRMELRGSFRIQISVSGRFVQMAEEGVIGGRLEVSFVTKDFSAGGVRITSPAFLRDGMKGNLTFDIPDSGLSALQAEVIRSSPVDDGQVVSNLRFFDLTPEQESRLFNLVREWERGLRALNKSRLLLNKVPH